MRRFPWARCSETLDVLGTPPGMYLADDPRRYPFYLEHRHVLVDHETLIRFMASVWGMSVTDGELNALEYHGILIPARKALAGDLCPTPRNDEQPDATICHISKSSWEHRGIALAGTRKQAAGRSESSTSARTLKLDLDKPLWAGPPVRPTPMLTVRHESTVIPKPHATDMPPDDPDRERHWPFGIDPPQQDRVYGHAELVSDGRWFRPTQLEYWQVLGWAPIESQFAPTKADARGDLGVDSLLRHPSAFGLNAREATWGNDRITRFYAIGMDRTPAHGEKRRWGILGQGFGQDWYLAELLVRLRARLKITSALELVRAEQAKKVNERREAYEALGQHTEFFRSEKRLHLPPIIPYFYRDVLLKLTYEALRASGANADEAHDRLRQASGHTYETMKKYVKRGARLLRGEPG